MRYWLYLALAIVLEVTGTPSMKLSEGFTKIVRSILMFVFYMASIAALTLTLKKIDVSVSYAVWAGLDQHCPRHWSAQRWQHGFES
jgi:small multidrug resistance pump